MFTVTHYKTIGQNTQESNTQKALPSRGIKEGEIRNNE